MQSGTRQPHLRRAAAVFCIGLYLLANVFFLVRNSVGATGPDPWAYFFTWDMYPFYRTTSSRPLAFGRTKNGTCVELLPSPLQEFRWGLDGTATRTDMDRGFRYTSSTIRKVLRSSKHADHNPIVHVYVIEEYWPARFNLPDDVYSRTIDWPPRSAGQSNPRRKYWKVLEEFDVEFGGTGR